MTIPDIEAFEGHCISLAITRRSLINWSSIEMPGLFETLSFDLKEEIIGLMGGAIFLGSWVLQAWESRQRGAPVVSLKFFALRSLASALLTFEGIRAGSLSVTLVMAATLVLMLYNAALILSDR